MKKYLILLLAFLLLILSSCNSAPSLYEYAISLTEDDMLVCADGNIWRIAEYDKYGHADLELVESLEPGEVNMEVRKENAEDMAVWEYLLLTLENEFTGVVMGEHAVAVGQDGSIWLVYQSSSKPSHGARPFEPVEEIREEQFEDGFWLEMWGIEESSGVGPPQVVVIMHDDNELLINPGFAMLEVQIDRQWYLTNTYYADTSEVKFFDKNNLYLRGAPLYAGDFPGDIPLPSGHYRIKAEADNYEEWKADGPQPERYAILEFDLIYEDGKHEIVNVKQDQQKIKLT